MAEIYGHRWVSSFGESPAPMWCSAMSRITDDQIRHGMAACVVKRIEWTPTLTEFIALCTAVVGIPSDDDAWSEAFEIARRWKRPHECSHPAVWHALSQVVNYSYVAEEALERRFKRNYEQVRKDLADGLVLAPIPQPLPRPENVKTNYDEATVAAAREKACAELDRMMGRKPQ